MVETIRIGMTLWDIAYFAMFFAVVGGVIGYLFGQVKK